MSDPSVTPRQMAAAEQMHYDEDRVRPEPEPDVEEYFAARNMTFSGINALAKEHGFGEPEPKKVEGPSMHDLVIVDMARRKEFGLAKYGTILQAGNGRNALQDAYEEVLDLAVYLRQRIEEDRESAEIIAYGAETAVRRVPVDPAIVEAVISEPVPAEKRCPSRGPRGVQCIFREGHSGRHRAANFKDVEKR